MRWTILALLFALAPHQGVPRDPKDFPVKVSSPHYELYTNGSKEQAQELADFMELVHDTYMAILRPEDPKTGDRKSDILLYKSNEDYLASGAPAGSGAYYSLQSKRLVGWYDQYFMRNFFAHEGMHQFTDLTSKSFQDFGMWFTEGIADCIGNSEVKNKKLYMCRRSGVIARMRLPTVQGAVKQKKHWSLSELFRLTQRQFMDPKNVDLAYSQSWSFCHFLIAYPEFDDKDSQIPNGKYRKNLAIYYETMRPGGVKHQEAWDDAFTKKGLTLDKLQKEWEEYILKMDAGKFMGFQGGELPEEEADKLGFEKTKTGIKIDKLVEDGVGKKSGMMDGDVIKTFDGRLFPRKGAMNSLRSWMQDVPYGRSIKVVVLRDGKDVECQCKWEEKKDAKK
jgi:hypothetical protein